MSKFFFHAFVSGKNIARDPCDTIPYKDSIGVVEIRSWAIDSSGIKTNSESSHPRGFDCRFDFAKGNRFYIVENNGQCQEPNGDIIWRNEDGAQGDDKPS